MTEPDSSQITRSSKSNLAFAFLSLPPERKRNLEIFYAFCRIVDDIADEPGPSPEEKHALLDRWDELVSSPAAFTPRSTLEREVQELASHPQIDRDAMRGIIAGCRSDIVIRPFDTLDDLLGYTYQVASCVGIVSATLFGASSAARPYAVALGHALQITNILRDAGEDWQKEGRIYLPRADMAAHGYTEEDLAGGVRNDAFRALMTKEARHAQDYYHEAARLLAALSPADRRALAPAEAMHRIYRNLLDNMISGGFDIFTRRYKLSKGKKLYHLAAAWWISRRS